MLKLKYISETEINMYRETPTSWQQHLYKSDLVLKLGNIFSVGNT